MLSRRLLTAVVRSSRPTTSLRHTAAVAPFSTTRCTAAAFELPPKTPRQQMAEADPINHDPEMNGGYLNPPRIKRQFRDPYGDWWDKQERRNFGEPVHEDNDILGMFSLYEYTHMSPARGALIWAILIAIVSGGVYGASFYYPDRPSAPKEYESGLDTELGGPGSVRAWRSGDKLEGVP